MCVCVCVRVCVYVCVCVCLCVHVCVLGGGGVGVVRVTLRPGYVTSIEISQRIPKVDIL